MYSWENPENFKRAEGSQEQAIILAVKFALADLHVIGEHTTSLGTGLITSSFFIFGTASPEKIVYSLSLTGKMLWYRLKCHWTISCRTL